MSASDYRKIARDNLEGSWWIAIGIGAVAYLLGGMLVGSSFLPEIEYSRDLYGYSTDAFDGNISISFGSGSIFGMAQFIIGGVVQLGYASYLLKQHDHKNTEFSDLFSRFDQFGQGFLQAFLRRLYVVLWSLLFIIPGIVASYSYAMTPFIMAENPEMSASDAITASKELMNGHKMDLFILDLSFFGWSLLAALTLNLGNLALNPYKNAAYAAFYRDITGMGQYCAPVIE